MSLFGFFRKKNEKSNAEAEEPVENEPQMLYAKFLFEREINLDKALIASELRKEFTRVDEAENTLLYFFPDYGVQYQDGIVPAQGMIMLTEEPVFDAESITTSLTQNWNWPAAAEVVGKCRYEFMVSDMMSRGLAYTERVEYFQKFLVALIRATKPQAVHFIQSNKLVDPWAYVLAVTEEEPDILNGLANVRFYNVADGANGEMFMDTLGLHALGLPDFQIRFTDSDPGAVANALWNYANYIYHNGVVIEPGNTIQGLSPDDKWICYYADGAVEPKRIVVDINPQHGE